MVPIVAGQFFCPALFYMNCMESKMTAEQESSIRRKPIVNVGSQIETLRSHGVRFERVTLDAASEFLERNTYFFKLKAFDKKFERNREGQYLNLDFAYLQDISTIDFHIRRFVQEMASDVEHALKVRFNVLLMRLEKADGYKLVSDFEQSQRNFYQSQKVARSFDLSREMKKSAYTANVINKYGKTPPAWLVWEVCSMNVVNQFYRFFLRKYNYEDSIYLLLDGVRKIRNAAAHSNCLFTAAAYQINKTERLHQYLELLLETVDGEHRDIVMRLSSYDPLTHDFACLVCSHINLVESGDLVVASQKTAQTPDEEISRTFEWYAGSATTNPELVYQLVAIRTLLRCYVNFDRESDDTVLSQAPQKYSRRKKKH